MSSRSTIQANTMKECTCKAVIIQDKGGPCPMKSCVATIGLLCTHRLCSLPMLSSPDVAIQLRRQQQRLRLRIRSIGQPLRIGPLCDSSNIEYNSSDSYSIHKHNLFMSIQVSAFLDRNHPKQDLHLILPFHSSTISSRHEVHSGPHPSIQKSGLLDPTAVLSTFPRRYPHQERSQADAT